MKILMLDASTYGEDVNIDKFYALGEVKSYSTSTREEALKRVAEHNPDVVIINKIAADKEFIDAAPALKMIAETATGYNNIDIMYAKEKNIRVANVAGYSTDSVVQHTFALGLYLIEKMSYYDGYVKSGEYAKCPIFSHFSNVFHELTGKTWGIVGLGTIGKGVAKIAADFGCKVIYYSASGKTQNVPYERKELDEFLKESDIISIHAPLNEKTQNLFNAAAFDKMKTSAILLNLGRGPKLFCLIGIKLSYSWYTYSIPIACNRMIYTERIYFISFYRQMFLLPIKFYHIYFKRKLRCYHP